MTQKVITLCPNKGFILGGLTASQGSCRDPSLGLTTRAHDQGKGLARVQAKIKFGSHIVMSLGIQKSVRERTLTFLSELPC